MPPTVRRPPAAPVRRPTPHHPPTSAAGAADPATSLTAAQLHILGQVYDLILAHARPDATP